MSFNKANYEALRDFERRQGCEERYLTGATGKEPLLGGVYNPATMTWVAPPCASLEGAALMATRVEFEEVRARLDGPSRVRPLGHNTDTRGGAP